MLTTAVRRSTVPRIEQLLTHLLTYFFFFLLILYRRRRFINHLLTYLLTYLSLFVCCANLAKTI